MTARRPERESIPKHARSISGEPGDRKVIVTWTPDKPEIVADDDAAPVERISRGLDHPNTLVRPRGVGSRMPSGTVMQHGVARVLQSLIFERQRPSGKVDEFRLNKVFTDWVINKDEDNPVEPPYALVTRESVDFEEIQPALIEDSTDVYGDGLVLVKTATATSTINVVIWAGHRDDRTVFESEIEDAFLMEPHEMLSGRRVVMPEYYDRVVRILYEGVNYPDNERTAQANQWIMVCRFRSDVDVVKPVKFVEMREPSFALDVE